MVTAGLREILNAQIFKRQPPFIGRTSMVKCEGTLQRTQPRRHADSLQDDRFRSIARVTAALFLAICGDRQGIGTNFFVWKGLLRVLGSSLQPKRTHRTSTPSNEAFLEHLPIIVRCRKGQSSVRRRRGHVTAAVVAFVLPLSCIDAAASGPNVSQRALASLQAKADQAQPKDRCFLYAMLVNQMTNLAGQQFDSDDPGQASETLKLVQRYLENIQTGVTGDSRKVKEAELLIRRSSFQLRNILRESSLENQLAMETTLKELNQVQEQLMTQVFKK
jgi:hypothetical protein